MRGGMEAIYDDIDSPFGFMRFAPVQLARGPMFAAADRAHAKGSEPPVIEESDLYNE